MPLTSAPTAETVPAASLPIVTGDSALYRPVRKYTSMKLTPAAATSMTTSCGPGTGVGTSSSTRRSGPPGSRTTMRFMIRLRSLPSEHLREDERCHDGGVRFDDE